MRQAKTAAIGSSIPACVRQNDNRCARRRWISPDKVRWDWVEWRMIRTRVDRSDILFVATIEVNVHLASFIAIYLQVHAIQVNVKNGAKLCVPIHLIYLKRTDDRIPRPTKCGSKVGRHVHEVQISLIIGSDLKGISCSPGYLVPYRTSHTIGRARLSPFCAIWRR